MSLVLLMAITISTIIYASFNTRLQITGEAYLRAKKDIRITGIELVGSSNSAYETYTSRYTTDTTTIYATLPAKSYIEYAITITNKSDVDYVVSKIQEISHNSSVTYTNNLKVNEDVIDAMSSSSGTDKVFNIKITNNTTSLQKETLFLQYTFEEATYTASQLSYSNNATSCKTVQCALDELAGMVE